MADVVLGFLPSHFAVGQQGGRSDTHDEIGCCVREETPLDDGNAEMANRDSEKSPTLEFLDDFDT